MADAATPRDETPSDDAIEIACAIRDGVSRMSRRLRQQRRPHELGVTSASILGNLYRNGPMSPSGLADAERVQPQSLTRTILALEQRGLVTRRQHAHDGRQVIVEITEAGRAIVNEDRRRRDAWLAETIMNDLTPLERDLLRVAAKALALLASR